MGLILAVSGLNQGCPVHLKGFHAGRTDLCCCQYARGLSSLGAGFGFVPKTEIAC